MEFITSDWLEPELQFYQMYCIGSFMELLPQVFWWFIPVLNALIIQEHRGLIFRRCIFVHSYVNLVLVLTMHLYLHPSWVAVYQHLQCNPSYSYLKSYPRLCKLYKPSWMTSTWGPSRLGGVSPERQLWTGVGVPEKDFSIFIAECLLVADYMAINNKLYIYAYIHF